jgi:hypothetical protein
MPQAGSHAGACSFSIDIDFTGAPVSSAELAPCAVTTPRLRSLRPPHLSDRILSCPAVDQRLANCPDVRELIDRIAS